MQQIDIRTHYVARSTLTGMFQGARYVPLKRAVDVLLAAGLLFVFAPLMALIVVAIKLCSRGPAIDRQLRIGCGGVPFGMLRFRSARCVQEVALHGAQELRLYQLPAGRIDQPHRLRRDPRVTRVGRILRRSGMDRLPQLLNVLRGEMSLVGPRPAQPRETELYEAWHRQRLSVPPGITGLWQVSGQSKRPIDDMARADLAYIATMSLWLDLRIMLRTPGILLRGRRRSV